MGGNVIIVLDKRPRAPCTRNSRCSTRTGWHREIGTTVNQHSFSTFPMSEHPLAGPRRCANILVSNVFQFNSPPLPNEFAVKQPFQQCSSGHIDQCRHRGLGALRKLSRAKYIVSHAWSFRSKAAKRNIPVCGNKFK
jgi:hypothetical protein